ncbi:MULTISPECIES: hypothetical protein [unclassified Rhizobium]|jgi:hypothetical protein|uniref:hypothetical protein n=1 Tax=unclassified Rhizobium TaxID=2613769 RepID=UPI00064834B0|nr:MULTISPECIES: hypothetical protein [unclassified Rhizobium]MBN8949559.1 hypothetical protein [Rhizobium tropici]OJY75342.1 MAG: hypothetical protein BGP09_36770 [Rhizobium sp. 60-20]RKD70655.1 hypothetical protein BJ928_103173 [Rhizobium sp. WW_1]
MKSLDLVVVERLLALLMLVLVVLAAALMPAMAGEVRLGKNVRVGGHDFSNQTFDSKHRARIYLYNQKPRKEGCVWHGDGHGGRVKVCHLQRK